MPPPGPQATKARAKPVQDLLDVIPATYCKRRTINEKYRSKADKNLPPVQEAMPPAPIPGTHCAPGHGKAKQGYFWVYSNPQTGTAACQWSQTRGHENPLQGLEKANFNGHIEIDNNLAENGVRPAKPGMKNRLFFGSAEAGHTSAAIYTIIENCKRQGLNPEACLKQVLEELPHNPTAEQAAKFTPSVIAGKQKSRISA